MSMASSPQHEPTMEEILASIRKIISEDSSEGQPAAPETRAAQSHEADVLELTQEVDDEPAAPPVVIAAPPPGSRSRSSRPSLSLRLPRVMSFSSRLRRSP